MCPRPGGRVRRQPCGPMPGVRDPSPLMLPPPVPGPRAGAISRGFPFDAGDQYAEVRLFLWGSCRGIKSRVRLHPWTFPGQLDSSEEAGLFMATGQIGRGSTWPHGHLLPRWAPQHPVPD